MLASLCHMAATLQNGSKKLVVGDIGAAGFWPVSEMPPPVRNVIFFELLSPACCFRYPESVMEVALLARNREGFLLSFCCSLCVGDS